MADCANERGFLPFFLNDIPDFSIADLCPPELWFSDEQEGPWDWKGPAIIDGDLAYGKFFQRKAGYISMEWFPDFVNYRRSVIQLTDTEKQMLDIIREHKSLLSKEIKRLCGYVKPRAKRYANPLEKMMDQEIQRREIKDKPRRESYETAITALQMSTMVVTADFEYGVDKQGNKYGFGVARYCTPEDFFGADRLIVDRTPEESFERMVAHLTKVLPWASQQDIERLIKP